MNIDVGQKARSGRDLWNQQFRELTFGMGKLIEVDNFYRDYRRVDESLSIGRRFDVFLINS